MLQWWENQFFVDVKSAVEDKEALLGRDLHAYLEYYDKEAGIWEGLAHFYFKRHRRLFDILIQNANGMPNIGKEPSYNLLAIAHPQLFSLEVWVAWREDRDRLGIHHEGHMSYDALCELFIELVPQDSPVPIELRALLDAAEVYDLRDYEIRFVYWFDN